MFVSINLRVHELLVLVHDAVERKFFIIVSRVGHLGASGIFNAVIFQISMWHFQLSMWFSKIPISFGGLVVAIH